MSSQNGGMTIEDIWDTTRSTVLAVWSKSTRRMRVIGGVVLFFILSTLLFRPSMPQSSSLPSIPKVTLDYGTPPPSQFNASKVALLIENRVNPILAPLMLHFMSVVPPDWRFRFMGSVESVALMNSSRAIRQHVDSGKLDLTYIPANMTTGSQEEISRFLTNLWLYETVLQPAEWLLVFQTDSMLCANSRQSLNNWLEYDWVGAPWNPHGRFGGNGGLSLRRVSAIIDVLRNQVREDNSQPEDVWLTDRLGHRPGAKLANGTASLTFSGKCTRARPNTLLPRRIRARGKTRRRRGLIKGVDDWRDGFYERWLSHWWSGVTLHSGIWGTPEKRKHIWDYCPEVKDDVCNGCREVRPRGLHSTWKRWDNGQEGVEGADDHVEIIDGVEYPMLRQICPW
ncbi:hypothetical protein EYC84_003037 [Monilinia fructicola]|uniref:DUF5672 domain-containing protein n=1 Tax=Monilinia fructicola TaxID=38448 RepID=A0A5M9K0J8_MONFR|nr:hypothetical protein EYC84_003037 [Monilinia fructicola]